MRGRRDDMFRDGAETEVVRYEEELLVDREPTEVGGVRVRKVVENERFQGLYSREAEHADVEREAAAEGDSGQVETLPDGSLSIPVFEEQLVVKKRLVVRERIIVRKHTVTEEHRIEADLARERVELDADPPIADRVIDAR